MILKTRERQVLTGAEAVAEAWRQIEPDVVSVYPITPQTPMIETFSEMVADGLVRTEIINVESEHSAMSAAVGAAAAGARVATATSSQGLALMLEICYIASSLRLPILMNVGARALSGPINIHCDHSDMYMARDAGWIQIFTEDTQEAYDYTIMAQRLGEIREVSLPVMVALDGFTTTHSAEVAELLPDKLVRDFVGEYEPPFSLLTRTATVGPFDMPDYYFEHKRTQQHAMEQVPEALARVQADFAELSGRSYKGPFEAYRLDDAKIGLVVVGSAAGTGKTVVDALRREGLRVGLLKPWLFRPFPREEIADVLRDVETVAVLDRGMSFGSTGPLHLEIGSALYSTVSAGRRGPQLVGVIYGLGGRDLRPDQIRELFEDLEVGRLHPDRLHYVGLRGRTHVGADPRVRPSEGEATQSWST